MTRQFYQDPTEFFSVVGAPFVREHHSDGYCVHERRTDELGQLLGVVDAVAAGLEAVVGQQLGPVDRQREALPLLGARGADGDPAVAALSKQGGAGVFSGGGIDYTLDLGIVYGWFGTVSTELAVSFRLAPHGPALLAERPSAPVQRDQRLWAGPAIL